MARPRQNTPTAGEMEILHALWAHGPSTVKQVQAVLCRARPRAYTSVMTLMGIMHQKGFVTRELDGRAFVYRARQTRERTAAAMLQQVVAAVFSGSPAAAIAQMLQQQQPTPQEVDAIRRVVEQYQKQRENEGAGRVVEIRPVTPPAPPGGCIRAIAHHAAPVDGVAPPPAGGSPGPRPATLTTAVPRNPHRAR